MPKGPIRVKDNPLKWHTHVRTDQKPLLLATQYKHDIHVIGTDEPIIELVEFFVGFQFFGSIPTPVFSGSWDMNGNSHVKVLIFPSREAAYEALEDTTHVISHPQGKHLIVIAL